MAAGAVRPVGSTPHTFIMDHVVLQRSFSSFGPVGLLDSVKHGHVLVMNLVSMIGNILTG